LNYRKLLERKNAVIINANSESGQAVALKFAEHGAIVGAGVNDVRGSESFLAELRKLSPESFTVKCNLADGNSCEEFGREINRRFSVVNVIVNNPYMKTNGGLLETTDEDDDILDQVYQRSHVQIMRAVWTNMLEAGNCAVVNISLGTAFKPIIGDPFNTGFNASVGGFSRVEVAEGAKKFIRSNEILAARGLYEDTQASSPLKDSGTTRTDIECVADTALFLASDMAGYINGVSINVDGGAKRALSGVF